MRTHASSHQHTPTHANTRQLTPTHVMGCTMSFAGLDAAGSRKVTCATPGIGDLQSTASSASLPVRGGIPLPLSPHPETPRQWISATMWQWNTDSAKQAQVVAGAGGGHANRDSDRPAGLATAPGAVPRCVAQFQEEQLLRGAVLKPSPHKTPPQQAQVDATGNGARPLAGAPTTPLADGPEECGQQRRESATFSPHTMHALGTACDIDMVLPWHSTPRLWSATATSGDYPPDLNSVCPPGPVEFLAAPPGEAYPPGTFPGAGDSSIVSVVCSSPR